MARHATPFELWKTGLDAWMLAVETQAVMTMRILGMGGLWSVDKRETQRMVFEKPEVFGRVVTAAALGVMTGERPDEILHSTSKKLRSKTRPNAKRLARRGPKLS